MSGTRISDMTPRTALAAGDMVPVVSGAGNYKFDLGKALSILSGAVIERFVGASGQDLTAGGTKPPPEIVYTSGNTIIGKGYAAYMLDAAVDSAFVAAHPGWSFRDSQGNGYRIAEGQLLRMTMFGAAIDGVTDDYPAWLSAKDFLQTYKVATNNAYYKSVPSLMFDRGKYYMSDMMDCTDGVYHIYGEGPSAPDQGGNVQILVAAGKCGIALQSWDTTGVTGTTTNTPKGSGGSVIEDLYFISLGGTVGAEQHGFLIKSPAILNRCGAYHFGGYAFLVAADVTHAGNANCGKMRDCVGWYSGKAGVKFVGGDSNAWEIYGFNAIGNREWGIHEESFLGNHFFGYHTASNGAAGSGPQWNAVARPFGLCNKTGHYYRVIPGQETFCAANAPTGAATSNQGWLYYGDGSANGMFPTWTAGQTWLAGGAFYVTGASNKAGVFGGYMESDQANGFCDNGRALIICGGFSGFSFPTGTGATIGAFNGHVCIPYFSTGDGSSGINITPTQVQIGAECFFQQTSSESFDLRGNSGGSLSMSRNTSGHQHAYSMSLPMGHILGSDSGGFTGIATAIPSSGTYTEGAFVRNKSPSVSGGKVVLGWLRLTTGSAHVLNTDWFPLTVPNT